MRDHFQSNQALLKDAFPSHFTGLDVPASMQVNLGKLCHFSKDEMKGRGHVGQYGTFLVTGFQRDYAGKLCYRVRCIDFNGKEFNDSFGCVMSLNAFVAGACPRRTKRVL